MKSLLFFSAVVSLLSLPCHAIRTEGTLVRGTAGDVKSRLIDLVDTRIGGGGIDVDTGCINPGAQVPYGAMRLGPDTSLGMEPFRPNQGYSCGYLHNDTQIMAFSHTHLVGAGVTDLQNIGLTVVREIDIDHVIKDERYGSPYSHDTEVARPGYYSAVLQRWNTKAEVTVGGTHAGMHRYTCKRTGGDSRNCVALLDICHSGWHNGTGGAGPNEACTHAILSKLEGNNTDHVKVSAWVDNHGGFSWNNPGLGNGGPNPGRGIQIWFHAMFEAVGASSGGSYTLGASCWINNALVNGACPIGVNTSSKSLGTLLTVNTHNSPPEDIIITARTALSFISADNAVKLLKDQLSSKTTTETVGKSSPSWLSFDELRARTQGVWEQTLARVQVDTGDNASFAASPLKSYYSALYRTHLSPTDYTEFGTYRSELDHIVTLPDSSYNFMSDLSIWDIFRSQMPLQMILEPQVARNTGWSMLTMFQERGFLPVWVLANVETFCMVGQHSAVILADFIRKGLKQLDSSAVFDAVVTGIRKQNTEMMAAPQHYHSYMNSNQYGSGSDTLDFAVDAAAVRNMALFLGNHSVANEFEPYANAWSNVWNSDRNIFCPKTPNGTWVCPEFDYRPNFQTKYREDNAGEYRWYVPQNLTGLVNSFRGGADTYANDLNKMFVIGQLWPLHAEGQPNWWFWAGNEPDMMAPYQFPPAGNKYAWLTDKWVAATLSMYYQPSPTYRGLPGNDDYGAMSSFEFMAFSGFYPVSSTNDYILSTPWFVNATFYIAAGQTSFTPFATAPAATEGGPSKIFQIRAHNHPGTGKLWEMASKLNSINSAFSYVANATINGVPLTSRVFTQEQLVSNVKPGEVTTIDIYLSSEPVVFGAAAPSAGGPQPFVPTNPLQSEVEEQLERIHQRGKPRRDWRPRK